VLYIYIGMQIFKTYLTALNNTLAFIMAANFDNGINSNSRYLETLIMKVRVILRAVRYVLKIRIPIYI